MTQDKAFESLLKDTGYIKSLPVAERRKINAYRAMYQRQKLKKLDGILSAHNFEKIEPEWELARRG